MGKDIPKTGRNEATEEEVRTLARLNGLTLEEGDLKEVTFRFRALLSAAQQLDRVDVSGTEPIAVLPEREVR